MKKERRPVCVGDVYKERDSRVNNRQMLVMAVGEKHATCERWYGAGLSAGKSRPAKISIYGLQTRWTYVGPSA